MLMENSPKNLIQANKQINSLHTHSVHTDRTPHTHTHTHTHRYPTLRSDRQTNRDAVHHARTHTHTHTRTYTHEYTHTHGNTRTAQTDAQSRHAHVLAQTHTSGMLRAHKSKPVAFSRREEHSVISPHSVSTLPPTLSPHSLSTPDTVESFWRD